VKLTIFCDDRPGMLKELTAIISDENTNIRSVDSRPGPNADAIVEFVVETEDVRHLTRLVQGMRRVPGVREVQRSQKL
jgi:GTP pyrophosphokinase